jgi:peroxiredoxin
VRNIGSVVTAAAIFVAAAVTAAEAEPLIGKPAPELVATTLDGQIFDLAALRGNVILVNYWATWCAPCRKDMPKLDGFFRRYHDLNLKMIGISVDDANALGKVRKVMAGLAYPVATLKNVTIDGFGPPEGVPITWVIDAKGEVRDRLIDVRDELLNGIVFPLLKR